MTTVSSYLTLSAFLEQFTKSDIGACIAKVDDFFKKAADGSPQIWPNIFEPHIKGVNGKIEDGRLILSCWQGNNGVMATNFNGIIFNRSYKMIASQPRALRKNSFIETEKINFKAYDIYEAFDGTCVTLYFDSGSWRIATARAINVSDYSYFGKTTFKEALADVIDELNEKGRKTFNYSFIMSHPDWNPCVTKKAVRFIQAFDLENNEVIKDGYMNEEQEAHFNSFTTFSVVKILKTRINFLEFMSRSADKVDPDGCVAICLRAKPTNLQYKDIIMHTRYYFDLHAAFYDAKSRNLPDLMMRAYIASFEDPVHFINKRFTKFRSMMYDYMLYINRVVIKHFLQSKAEIEVPESIDKETADLAVELIIKKFDKVASIKLNNVITICTGISDLFKSEEDLRAIFYKKIEFA